MDTSPPPFYITGDCLVSSYTILFQHRHTILKDTEKLGDSHE